MSPIRGGGGDGGCGGGNDVSKGGCPQSRRILHLTQRGALARVEKHNTVLIIQQEAILPTAAAEPN